MVYMGTVNNSNKVKYGGGHMVYMGTVSNSNKV